MGKRVVILSGGTGGLVVANQLREELSQDNEIVLVEREKNHLFSPSLLWLMVGWRTREHIQKTLSLLQRKGIKFINASVQRIDSEKRTVSTSEGDIPFDYSAIALGASTFPEKIPGFLEGACNLYDLSGAERIRDAIRNFSKGRDGTAGYASGNFYLEPRPEVNVRRPSRFWHLGKVFFEKWWLWKWF